MIRPDVRVRPAWATVGVLTAVRRGAVTVWAGLLIASIVLDGLPIDRAGLFTWIVTGLVAASIGRRPLIWAVMDFAPLVGVLIAYDYLRGLSDELGMPTWWNPQIRADRLLFGGHEPTVWLQEHLMSPTVRWYDIVCCLCYNSFFFLPYIAAAIFWLRNRRVYFAWALRFAAMSLMGFVLVALVPAAPPWAAARCTGADVVGHVSAPACLSAAPHRVPGNVLGRYQAHIPGAPDFVERTSERALATMHLRFAGSLFDEGAAVSDPVAAFPSIHTAGITLFCLFMWRRLRRRWRPVLLLYPPLMAFSLVYTANHYVVDCIAGALLALVVDRVGLLIERRRTAPALDVSEVR